MKPFAISESHLTLSEVSVREQGQRRFTLTASACVRLYNISKHSDVPLLSRGQLFFPAAFGEVVTSSRAIVVLSCYFHS